jgi:hypothetical protein
MTFCCLSHGRSVCVSLSLSPICLSLPSLLLSPPARSAILPPTHPRPPRASDGAARDLIFSQFLDRAGHFPPLKPRIGPSLPIITTAVRWCRTISLSLPPPTLRSGPPLLVIVTRDAGEAGNKKIKIKKDQTVLCQTYLSYLSGPQDISHSKRWIRPYR